MSEIAVKSNNGSVVEKTQRRIVYTPQVDILELPEEMVLQLDMPGVKAEDIEIQYERGELAVRGKRQVRQRTGHGLVEEFETGDFYRAFLLSQDVAGDRISAELKNGVLTVHLPRHEATKPRKVSVKVA